MPEERRKVYCPGCRSSQWFEPAESGRWVCPRCGKRVTFRDGE